MSPTIHKFGDEFIHSGLSVVRHAHHPEFFEGLSEYAKAFHWIAYVTVIANRSTKPSLLICMASDILKAPFLRVKQQLQYNIVTE
jgi:hypothetical protein